MTGISHCYVDLYRAFSEGQELLFSVQVVLFNRSECNPSGFPSTFCNLASKPQPLVSLCLYGLLSLRQRHNEDDLLSCF